MNQFCIKINKLVDKKEAKGVSDGNDRLVLFAPDCLRISPPLIISEEQVMNAAQIILATCG